MQKITFLVVGKIKESFYREAVAEYAKRLSRFVKLEIKEVTERDDPAQEKEDILRSIKGYTVALCIEGKKMDSEGLASLVKTCADKGQDITFIIGSSHGLADEVKQKADFKLSFSDMTFPHQLMRVILAEQVYRACMINAGASYHK